MKYRCHYFKNTIDTDFVYANSLHDLKDGFWVNKNWVFTFGSDAKYYIPAGRIIIIQKFKG